jgi:hypothetical protein
MKILAIVLTAIGTLATLLQGTVALIDLRSRSGNSKKWLISLSICLLLTIISGIVSYVSPAQTSSPSSTPISNVLPPTPSLTATSSSQPSPTATLISQLTPAVTPTLAADGTIAKNQRLTCGNCSSDPILFTIDGITIDNAHGRSIWNVTLQNVGGSYCHVYNYQSEGITLQDTESVNPPTPITLSEIAAIDAGSQYTAKFVFAFPIYKGVQYTFSVHINTNISGEDMLFDPFDIFF